MHKNITTKPDEKGMNKKKENTNKYTNVKYKTR